MSLPFPRLKLPQHLLFGLVLPPLPNSLALLWTRSSPSMSFSSRGGRMDTALQLQPQQCPAQGTGQCPAPAAPLLLTQASMPLAFLPPGHMLPHLQLLFTASPGSFRTSCTFDFKYSIQNVKMSFSLLATQDSSSKSFSFSPSPGSNGIFKWS